MIDVVSDLQSDRNESLPLEKELVQRSEEEEWEAHTVQETPLLMAEVRTVKSNPLCCAVHMICEYSSPSPNHSFLLFCFVFCSRRQRRWNEEKAPRQRI